MLAVTSGGLFADVLRIVAQQRSSLDDKPGPLPDITSDDDSVTFEMSVTALGRRARLRVRCDVRGDVWVTIAGDAQEE